MSEQIGEETRFENPVDFGGDAEIAASEITLEVPGESTTEADEGVDLERLRLLGIEVFDGIPELDTDAAALLPPEVAVRLRVVPISMENGGIRIAMLNPLDTEAVDEVAIRTSREVHRVGLEAPSFAELMKSAYGTTAARMAESLAADDDIASENEHNLDAIEADDVHQMAEQPSLINLVNLVLLEAIQSRTSDVHVEPFEDELKVKYRIDGVLREQPSPPKHLQAALVGRIKIMAHMNIAERYVPQDGHISLRFEGRKVDIRVSTVPTLYGESVVMRILDKSSPPARSQEPGNGRAGSGDDGQRLIAKPHGLVLVTGPTGSGKTTSLYAGLSKLYDPRKKIITIEDPVEYELGGNQPDPGQPEAGTDLRLGASLDPPPGPGRDLRRRDPRCRDGRHRDPFGPHRSPRVLDAAHQRRDLLGRPDDRHGRRAVPRRVGAGRPARPATRPADLQPLPDARFRDVRRICGIGCRRRSRSRLEGMSVRRDGLREVLEHRIPRTNRFL